MRRSHCFFEHSPDAGNLFRVKRGGENHVDEGGGNGHIEGICGYRIKFNGFVDRQLFRQGYQDQAGLLMVFKHSEHFLHLRHQGAETDHCNELPGEAQQA